MFAGEIQLFVTVYTGKKNPQKVIIQTKPQHKSFYYGTKSVHSDFRTCKFITYENKPFQGEREKLCWVVRLPEPLRVQSNDLSIRHGEMHLSAGRCPGTQLGFVV